MLVFAEPGDPHTNESHTGIESAYEYATDTLQTGTDLFHRKVKLILGMCWPDLTFEQQLRKVWLTDSVLCSAPVEGGKVSSSAAQACGSRYLVAQLRLFPKALVVALGSKATARMRALGIQGFLSAHAAAPPGCNFSGAVPSWQRIPAELERRRSLRV